MIQWRLGRRSAACAATIVLGASATTALLLPVGADARTTLTFAAAISGANDLTVTGRVRPAVIGGRVRVQTKLTLVDRDGTRVRWMRLIDSARLRVHGRFRVSVPAGGPSAIIRVSVLSPRGRVLERGRAMTVVSANARNGRVSPVDGVAPGGGAHPPAASARDSTLPAGQTLMPGERIESPNKRFRLVMQGDGNLVLYRDGRHAIWASDTSGAAGSRAVMQSDGNLVVVNGAMPRWSARTQGFDGAALAVQDDGNLVVYHAGRAIWTWAAGYVGDRLTPSSELPAGALLRSANRRFLLTMQSDGNLVLYESGGGALWATGSRGNGARLVMQGDGNAVVYVGSTAVWNSNGSGFAGAFLMLQDDGNAVVYHGGHPIWTYTDGYVGNRLHAGWTLNPGSYLISADHRFTLVMQPSDSNLGLYGPSGALWGWGTNGPPGARAVMQEDGNFVVYNGQQAVKSTGTAGHPGAFLLVQDDDNVVLYGRATALWSRHGIAAPPPAGDGGYPNAAAVDCSAKFGIYGWCVGGWWLSPRGYAYRNCTDWAAWRLQQMGASDAATRGLGNGGDWGSSAGVARTSMVPTVGRAAVRPSGPSDRYGHVAVVEAVHADGRITVSEYNAAGTGRYSTWTGRPADRGFTQFVSFGI